MSITTVQHKGTSVNSVNWNGPQGSERELSDAALDYCRGGTHAHGPHWGFNFRTGYRKFYQGEPRSECRTDAEREGWNYAHGEDCYAECMAIEAAQDSADAAGYGWNF